MGNSSIGAGNVKGEPEISCTLENKETLKKQKQTIEVLMWHRACWKNCHWPKLEECEQENNSIGL